MVSEPWLILGRGLPVLETLTCMPRLPVNEARGKRSSPLRPVNISCPGIADSCNEKKG